MSGGVVAALRQADSEEALRELRLQLAQQISLLAAERTHSSLKEKLCRGGESSPPVLPVPHLAEVCDAVSPPSDDRVELLLQKADRVLNSLSQGCGAAEAPAEPAGRSSPPGW